MNTKQKKIKGLYNRSEEVLNKPKYSDKKLPINKVRRDKEQKKFSDLISFVDFKEKMPW
jgi:hypothetical protein